MSMAIAGHGEEELDEANRNRQVLFRSSRAKFSHRIQLHQGLNRPNYRRHSPLGLLPKLPSGVPRWSSKLLSELFSKSSRTPSRPLPATLSGQLLPGSPCQLVNQHCQSGSSIVDVGTPENQRAHRIICASLLFAW